MWSEGLLRRVRACWPHHTTPDHTTRRPSISISMIGLRSVRTYACMHCLRRTEKCDIPSILVLLTQAHCLFRHDDDHDDDEPVIPSNDDVGRGRNEGKGSGAEAYSAAAAAAAAHMHVDNVQESMPPCLPASEPLRGLLCATHLREERTGMMSAIEYISRRDGGREKKRERERAVKTEINQPTSSLPTATRTRNLTHKQPTASLLRKACARASNAVPPNHHHHRSHSKSRTTPVRVAQVRPSLPFSRTEKAKGKGKRRGRSEIINLRATRRSRSRACGALGRTRVAT